MRHLLALALFSGCALPDAVRRGDGALSNGYYEAAVEHYEEAQRGYLTESEWKHVGEGLIEASHGAALAKLKELEASHTEREDRLAALYDVWETHRAEAGEQPLGLAILERIDAEIAEEWGASQQMLAEGRLGEGIVEARRWAQYAPPGSVYHSQYVALIEATQTAFTESADRAEGATRLFYQRLAAHYGAALPDEAVAAYDALRRMDVAYEGAPDCPSVPGGSSEPDLSVRLSLSTCDTERRTDSYEEDYTWTTERIEKEWETQCGQEVIGYETQVVPGVQQCHWETGSAGVLRFWVCDSNDTYREVPVYGTVCNEVLVETVFIDTHEGTRTVERVRTTHTVRGRFEARLPDGTMQSSGLELSHNHVDLAWSTPQGSKAFDGDGVAVSESTVRDQLRSRVNGVFLEAYRTARGTAAQRQGRAATSDAARTEAFATAAMLGVLEEDWLRGQGLTPEVFTAVLDGHTMTLPVPESAGDPETYGISWVNPETLTGLDATAARGYPFGSGALLFVWRTIDGIEDQDKRAGFALEYEQAFSFFAALRRTGWGLGIQDQFRFHFGMGGRTSARNTYGETDEDNWENWGHGGAGLSYQLTYGIRERHFGLRGGLHAYADAFKLGDVGGNSAGIPLVAQLEFRANERYPVIFEFRGLSPVKDKGLLAASIDWPLGGTGRMVVEWERSNSMRRLRRNDTAAESLGRGPVQVVIVSAMGAF